MFALKVSINGKHLCTAGADDLGVLNTIVNAIGPLGKNTVTPRKSEAPDFFLSVGGLTSRGNSDDEHLRWTDHQSLSLGDTVEVTLVEVDDVDEAIDRFPKKTK